MINHDRNRARELVEALHAVAEHAANDEPGSELAQLLQDAAVLLDSYQAGLILAMPHPATGYTLVVDPRFVADTPQTFIDQEAA